MLLKELLKSSPLSRLETEILLAFLLKKDREFVLTYPEIKISSALYKNFQGLVLKRSQNWPIAYLIGQKEFYGLDFKVNKNVLIPRPETELLVTEIIDSVKKTKKIKTIVDIGTGSGAIIISVAKELKKQAPQLFKTTKFLAVDISPSALKIAKQNAQLNELTDKINFSRGNLLTPISKKLIKQDLIIAANLPYLTSQQIKQSLSIKKEPRLALDGGRAGLQYYQELFAQAKKIHYRSTLFFCEIDPSQKIKIKNLAKKYFPNKETPILKDWRQKNRFLVIKDN